MMRITEDNGGDVWHAWYWSITITVSRYAGLLSFFGSSWILADILLDRKKRGMCYHRIIFGLSFFDMLSSFWYIMGPLAQPRPEYSGIWSASSNYGTYATCDASGYFIYLGSLTIPLYNAALSMYYYLSISASWSEERIKKKFERFVHVLIIPTLAIIAIIPIFFKSYNPWYNHCFVTFNPARNTTETSAIIFFLLFAVSLFLSSFIIGSSQICISQGKNKRLTSSLQDNESIALRRKKEEALIEASNMSILYTIPFFLTWFVALVWYTLVFFTWHTSFQIIPSNPKLIFTMQLYLALFTPLQGFFNLLVYLRPRFRKFRRGGSCCNAVAKTMLRLLNRSSSGSDDGDCYLGTGMIDGEEETEMAVNTNNTAAVADAVILEENNAEERGSAAVAAEEGEAKQQDDGDDSHTDRWV